MIEWQDKVERPHLVCHRTGTVIEAGTAFYSGLRFAEGHFVRLDFTEEGWRDRDPAETFLSWWRYRRPAASAQRGPRMVNNTILLGLFNDLRDATERPKQCFAWLLALLLMRNKRLRFLDLEQKDGQSYLLLEDREAKLAYRVRDPRMDAQEQARVEEELRGIFEFGVEVEETGEVTVAAPVMESDEST